MCLSAPCSLRTCKQGRRRCLGSAVPTDMSIRRLAVVCGNTSARSRCCLLKGFLRCTVVRRMTLRLRAGTLGLLLPNELHSLAQGVAAPCTPASWSERMSTMMHCRAQAAAEPCAVEAGHHRPARRVRLL